MYTSPSLSWTQNGRVWVSRTSRRGLQRRESRFWWLQLQRPPLSKRVTRAPNGTTKKRDGAAATARGDGGSAAVAARTPERCKGATAVTATLFDDVKFSAPRCRPNCSSVLRRRWHRTNSCAKFCASPKVAQSATGAHILRVTRTHVA